VNVVQDIDADSLQLQREIQRNFPRPRAFVVVSPDCVNGCQLAQLFEDLGSADVAGMDDVPDSRKRTDCFRAKQPVRIGDETYRFQRPYSPSSSAFPSELALTL
jgi:hypothetical protein